jgi:spore germination protein YaaH
MKRKISSIILITCILIAVFTPIIAVASSDSYSDVPKGHWSESEVYAAKKYGLMRGMGDGSFGLGRLITKAEFLTVLCNMFEWDLLNPGIQSFEDVNKNEWYFPYIETALKNDVIDSSKQFYPNNPITREEMAVMLVRALGYKTLADTISIDHNFKDLEDNEAYITIAYDIGMTKGTSPTTFEPKSMAKREEVAAMLVRVYEKYRDDIDWIHGFYAFSSYSQRELTKDMDAVSLGWSRLSYDPLTGVYLNTTSEDKNEWHIPIAYETIISYLRENSTKTHLNVFMNTSLHITMEDGSIKNICEVVLLDDERRQQAVNVIKNELTKEYSKLGYNPYNGVTIDFEGMKGNELKEGFTIFLKELAQELKSLDKSLYVTVHPKLEGGVYFDAYDYRAIGEIADKVILMAHDYNVTRMPENLLGSQYYRNTALTPFASIYYALKAIADENTGVSDTSKIALAVSFSSVGWQLEDSKVASVNSVRPAPSTIYSRLKGGAEMGYSEVYRNPYITYTTEDGTEIFLWYEDERSVNDKLQLAKLFGISGVSLWRIGNIPDYEDEGIYYNVLDSILN